MKRYTYAGSLTVEASLLMPVMILLLTGLLVLTVHLYQSTERAAEDLTVGKAVEIINVSGKILSGQHTFLCRPIIPFSPMYLGYYLNSADFHDQVVPYVTGTKVSSINKPSLCSLTVKYPDIPEQRAIAETLSDMDKEILTIEERLAKARQV